MGKKTLTLRVARKLFSSINTVGEVCELLGIEFYQGVADKETFRDQHIELLYKAYRMLIEDGQIDPSLIFNLNEQEYAHLSENKLNDLAFLDDSLLMCVGDCWEYIKVF